MEEVTGFRAWLRSKAKMITIYAGALAAVISVAVGWTQLGLDRPAFTSEIEELRQEVGSNTQLILNDKWFRLRAQITLIEAKLRADPTNRALIEELTRLQQSFRKVEEGLK